MLTDVVTFFVVVVVVPRGPLTPSEIVQEALGRPPTQLVLRAFTPFSAFPPVHLAAFCYCFPHPVTMATLCLP